MRRVYQFGLFILLNATAAGCSGQNKTPVGQPHLPANNELVGGGCDGCELMFVGMPQNINSSDTSAGWIERGQKLLITGTVYKLDGKTPAPNVIIYYWQTDTNGYYSPKDGIDEIATQHGHIRGWVKTDSSGKYSIYTIRPSPYPNANIPAHIHTSIKEPEIENEYFIDDFVFDDDKLLIPEMKRNPSQNRGGSGILRVLISGKLQIADHNIILGLNIPNYPETLRSEKQSGLEIGEDNPSFIPYHAWGPDKGTRTCPVCKYGRYHGIIYFVGNNPDWDDIKKWLTYLEKESDNRSNYLKAYFVYGNENEYSQSKRQKELENVGKELNLEKVALTFVPSLTDSESEASLNEINPMVGNTFVVYRHRTIVDKYIDLKANAENFRLLSTTLDKTKGDYFELSEPTHK